ncbi:MAG TPA: hypothetical protein VJ991_08585 [Balneolales bacterium]|nr:hypothetical protein [Balneolales bacterium]
MELEQGKYYHIYNSCIEGDKLFREHSDYLLFLKKYRQFLNKELSVLAYCLMPTQFHFLVKVVGDDITRIKKYIGILQGTYAKMINIKTGRSGSLFPNRAISKLIDNQADLLIIATYIHQKPLRDKLSEHLKDWPYSSYPDYAGLRNGTLPSRDSIMNQFQNKDDFVKFSNKTITNIKNEYWI